MSVQTYNELRAQLKRWTRRQDIDDIFDTAIELVENEIYTGKSPLRVTELIATATDDCVIDDRTMPIPSGFIEMIKIEIEADATHTYPLEFINVSDMPTVVDSLRPRRYTLTDTLIFDTSPDDDYTVNFTYFKRFDKLTETNSTNTLLQNYPNLYFFGLQAVIFDYAGEPDLAQIKKAQFDADISGANHKFKTGSFGPNLKMAGKQFEGGYRLPTTMRIR